MNEINFEQALTEELKTITNRVYPYKAPEKVENPYIIYTSSEGLRDKSITEGYLNSKRVSAEINVIASKYSIFKETIKQTIDLLVNMEKRIIGTNGVFIDELVYEQPVELYEANANVYRCAIEIRAYMRE